MQEDTKRSIVQFEKKLIVNVFEVSINIYNY